MIIINDYYSHHFKTCTAVRKHEDVILGLLLPVVPLGQEPVLLVFLTTNPVNRSVFILAVCAVCPWRHTHRDLHLQQSGVCRVLQQSGVCRVLLDQELETTFYVLSHNRCNNLFSRLTGISLITSSNSSVSYFTSPDVWH